MVIDQLKDENLYPSIDPPEVRDSEGLIEDMQYSLSSPVNISIENPNSAGTIYYTLNDDDPRAVGGGIASSAAVMGDGEDMDLTSSTILKARVYDDGTWSALKHITFIGQEDNNLTRSI